MVSGLMRACFSICILGIVGSAWNSSRTVRLSAAEYSTEYSSGWQRRDRRVVFLSGRTSPCRVPEVFRFSRSFIHLAGTKLGHSPDRQRAALLMAAFQAAIQPLCREVGARLPDAGYNARPSVHRYVLVRHLLTPVHFRWPSVSLVIGPSRTTPLSPNTAKTRGTLTLLRVHRGRLTPNLLPLPPHSPSRSLPLPNPLLFPRPRPYPRSRPFPRRLRSLCLKLPLLQNRRPLLRPHSNASHVVSSLPTRQGSASTNVVSTPRRRLTTASRARCSSRPRRRSLSICGTSPRTRSAQSASLPS